MNDAKAAEYAAEFYGGIPGARELLIASTDGTRHPEERDRARLALNLLDTSNPLPDREAFASLLDEARTQWVEEEDADANIDDFVNDETAVAQELKLVRRGR